MQQEPGLIEEDVLLAVTTLSFDIAGLELFLPLSVGAQVVIASREVASDGTLLCQELEKSGYDHAGNSHNLADALKCRLARQSTIENFLRW